MPSLRTINGAPDRHAPCVCGWLWGSHGDRITILLISWLKVTLAHYSFFFLTVQIVVDTPPRWMASGQQTLAMYPRLTVSRRTIAWCYVSVRLRVNSANASSATVASTEFVSQPLAHRIAVNCGGHRYHKFNFYPFCYAYDLSECL